MKRRTFIKSAAAGVSSLYLMGCSDDDGGESPVNNDAPAFYIPNDEGESLEFAVIGDVHSNGNILKGALEEVERRGIKHVLLVGDQSDSFLAGDYIEGFTEAEAYIKMIEENQFNTRLNLYPIRGNHEGLRTEFDDMFADDIFDRMKSSWKSTIGTLVGNNPDLIKPNYIREDTGEALDCSGLYAFKLDNTLFIAGDPYISEAWTTLPYDREKILTRTSTGEAIYSYQDWVLIHDFMEQVISEHQGTFEHLIVFNHYPLAGRNHAGILEDEVGGVPVPGYLPQLESSDGSGITAKLLDLLSKNNAIYISGHDHIFTKSLIFPQGASDDTSEHIHYADYETPEDNEIGASAEDLFPSNPIRQFIFGSCSQKHYDITRYYADGYEVPLYAQATNRTEGKVSLFGQFKITGSLVDISVWGNEHDFGSDGFKDQYKTDNQGIDVEQHFLDEANWQMLLTTQTMTQSQRLVVPTNYSYATEIPSQPDDTGEHTLKGTSARITDGNNSTYNAIDKYKDGIADKAKFYAFSEELCFKWLASEHWQVLSDVLLISGMTEQQGLVTDQNGNDTDMSDPSVGIYNDSVISKDTFKIGFSLGSIPDTQTCTLAFYHEDSEQWIQLSSYQEGGYIYSESVKVNGYFAIVATSE